MITLAPAGIGLSSSHGSSGVLRQGDHEPALLGRGAQRDGVGRRDRTIEQLLAAGREHVGRARLLHVPAPVEQRGGRQRCEHRRVVEGVPVRRRPAARERLLRIGVLHHGVPALQAGRARQIERDGVPVRHREALHVPLRHDQRPADDLRGGDPVHQVGRVERVLLQLADAAVGVHRDDVAGRQRRQRAQRIAAPGAGRGDQRPRAEPAQVADLARR